MKRKELIDSDEYNIASIELELWRLAGQPAYNTGKYLTMAKKIYKIMKPVIEERIELAVAAATSAPPPCN